MKALIFALMFMLLGVSESYAGKVRKVEESAFKQVSREKYPSELLSNRYNIDDNKLIRDLVVVPIFDVSYVAYRSEFAEAHGYSLDPEYVDDNMSPGLQAVEFTVKTIGTRALCGMNLLVDKKLELDFPDEEVIMKSYGGTKMRLPNDEARRMGKEEFGFLKDRHSSEATYNQNVSIATGDYSIKKKKGGLSSVSFREFSPKYFKNANYIKTRIGCSDLIRRKLKDKDPVIWLKKADVKKYSNSKLYNEGRSRDDYYVLKLPKDAIAKILPVMERTDGYHYNNNGFIRLKEKSDD